MIYFIIGFSLFFATILFIYAKKGQAFKRTSLLFAQLFLVCSLSLSIIQTSKYKEEIVQWFQGIRFNQDQTSIVYAEENVESFIQPKLYEDYLIADSVLIDAPHIQQLPELPRGCEVTVLAMLLRYHGVDVDKMTLAEEVKKDNTPYEVKDGKIYFGNPYDGFVGDMYSFYNPGLGVYHGPIAELAEDYVGDRVVDLTGHSFESVLVFLDREEPVFVIINGAYKPLPESSFETWHTPSGTLDITYRQHAVLVVGYDADYIYYNDPLQYELKKAPKDEFIGAWEQMGKQAVTILNES